MPTVSSGVSRQVEVEIEEGDIRANDANPRAWSAVGRPRFEAVLSRGIVRDVRDDRLPRLGTSVRAMPFGSRGYGNLEDTVCCKSASVPCTHQEARTAD